MIVLHPDENSRGVQANGWLGRPHLTLVVGADVSDGEQPVVADHAAVPANADPGQLHVGLGDRRGQVGRVGRDVAELDQRLQRGFVGQGEQPEQFRPSAALVQVHPDGFFLFLAHLERRTVRNNRSSSFRRKRTP